MGEETHLQYNADEVNKLFHEKYDNKKVTLDELESLFSESGYICVGHGTGRSTDQDYVIDSIFEKGLRTKDNSLYFTTVVLSTPTEEIIEKNKEIGIEPPTMESFKKQLNNWEHFDSKKIIIARIPTDYVNWLGNSSDIDGERYGAFMNEIIQDNGQVNYYLDSKFIIGCYDRDTESIRINSKFEKELTKETIEKLQERYLNILKEIKERFMKMSNIFFSNIGNNLEEDSTDNTK